MFSPSIESQNCQFHRHPARRFPPNRHTRAVDLYQVLVWNQVRSSGRERAGKMNFSNRTWPSWVPRLLWIRRECPYCNSLKFKQAESRSYDSLLSMIALHPVRCLFCWRRFYWFAWTGAVAS